MEAYLPVLKLKIKIMFTKFYKLFGKQHENEKFQLRKLNLKGFYKLSSLNQASAGWVKCIRFVCVANRHYFFILTKHI